MSKLIRSLKRGALRASSEVNFKIVGTVAQGFLAHEDSKCLLVGPSEDVKRLQNMDLMIGKLAQPFNGHAAVPDKQLVLMKQHIDDVSASLARVKAFKIIMPKEDNLFGSLEKLLSGDLAENSGKKQRIYSLNYTHQYKGVFKQSQKIASLQVAG